MRRPFEGIRVLEWGIFHAGPGGTAILCDMGAEVIKIEQPGIGDPVRLAAQYKGIGFRLPDTSSLFYAGSNRGKKSITLNLEHPQGKQIAYNLVRKSDIFFTNLRRSTVKKMQMDYPTLSQINPRLIYASVTGFGSRGPDADKGGFDYQGQGRSGMMYSFGGPGMPPLIGQFGIVDQATAIMASYQMVIALFMRERFGMGQEVDVSLLSTASYLLYFNYLVPLITGREIPRHDQANASALRNHYLCQDGKWLVQTQPPGVENWKEVCQVLGHPELVDDPRFNSASKRFENSKELVAIFSKAFATNPRDEWLRLFAEKNLVICAINTITEAIEDPQMIENGYIVDFEHPDMGHMRIPGFPIHFSQAQVDNNLLAPKLGEQTESVLKEIGDYSDKDIAQFREDGVI
jgi:crotonobetainyl-CoA:carnitine CoA-transferase CaiB-like acyl-CoA transferase